VYSESRAVQHLESCDANCVGPIATDDVRLSACHCEKLPDATPEAIAMWKARRACTTSTCASTCQAADLDCMGAASWPAPIAEPIHYRFVGIDYTTQTVAPGTVAACAITDPDCTSPLAGPLPWSDQQPAELVLPYRGFGEHFADRLEALVGGYRNRLYQVPPIAQSITVSWPVYSASSMAAIVAGAGIPAQDVTKGFLGVSVLDCSGKPLKGMTVSTDPPADPFYFASPSGTETGDLGVAMFPNLAPGQVRVTGSLGGARYGSASVQVAAGQGFTILALNATP
jgi:hypothetical protein